MKSIIDDLRRENNELRGEDVKKTEQLAVLEKKLKVLKSNLKKQTTRSKHGKLNVKIMMTGFPKFTKA